MTRISSVWYINLHGVNVEGLPTYLSQSIYSTEQSLINLRLLGCQIGVTYGDINEQLGLTFASKTLIVLAEKLGPTKLPYWTIASKLDKIPEGTRDLWILDQYHPLALLRTREEQDRPIIIGKVDYQGSYRP
jgi:hypothetical protein